MFGMNYIISLLISVMRVLVYLLLCATQHADGTDVIGVLRQSPLSFDSIGYSLRDIDRLESK